MTQPRITRDALERAVASSPISFASGPIDVSRALPAGVAVPISLAPEPTLHLVLRSSHLADHAGEIGFPGGKPDAADSGLRATAARELFEEVGVSEAEVEWLGELSPCPVITGRYVIHPFVALLADGARLRVASGEIAEVLSLPLQPFFGGGERVRAIEVEWGGARVLAPHFPVGRHILYGATAYIAYELFARLARALDHDLEPPVIEHAAPWGARYRKKQESQ